MRPSLHDSIVKLQNYLRTHTFEQLEAEHAVRAKSDGSHIILDYDQIAINWSTSVFGWVCRGLVLDAQTFEVLAFGLDKFFNEGEHYAAKINWSEAKILEKLDGSMVNRWWSPRTERWEYSTRYQLPHELERNNVGDFGITWRQLIDKCMATVGDIQQSKDETLAFEVMSPYNKVVVEHKKCFAKIICSRNNVTLVETDITNHPFAPKSFAFEDAKEVAEFARTLKGTESEGFVVVSGPDRVKIKGDNYVYLHRLKDKLHSMKNVLLLARSNDSEEVLLHFPEFKEQVLIFEKTIKEFLDRHEAVYEQYKSLASQKEFAIAIQKSGIEFTGALFATRAGKAKSVREAILHMEDNAFVKLFKPIVQKHTRFIIDEE